MGLGTVVVNLSHTVAVVVGVVGKDMLILKCWNGKKATGGKWMANAAKCRLATLMETLEPWAV